MFSIITYMVNDCPLPFLEIFYPFFWLPQLF